MDKERIVTTLEKSVTTFEDRLQRVGREATTLDDTDGETTRQNRLEHTESMLEGLRRIAQEVVNHCDRMEDFSVEEGHTTSTVRIRRSDSKSPRRDRSPSRSASRGRSHSPSFVDNTFTAIQGAFQTCRLQINELRSRLAAAQDQNLSIKKHVDDAEGERRHLENALRSLKEEKDFL